MQGREGRVGRVGPAGVLVALHGQRHKSGSAGQVLELELGLRGRGLQCCRAVRCPIDGATGGRWRTAASGWVCSSQARV